MMHLRIVIAALLLTLVVQAVATPVVARALDGVQVAQAQPPQAERPRRRTLLDMLFGNNEPQQAPIPEIAPTPVPEAQRRVTVAPSTPPAPVVPEIAKTEAATRVAVMGDSLAVDLGKALERFYADDPNLQVVPMGVGSSGLVRDDFYDWPGAVREAIANDSFDLAVVFIGINDRQVLSSGGQSLKALTEPWSAAYSARLNAFLGEMRTAGKPVVWVGLPPMEAPSYGAAMTQISGLQRLASLANGAEFVDIYERFLDDNGVYSAYGPDLNGQRVLMRKSDGIHLSAAGADKLAFYVSQSIKNFYVGGGVGIEIADPLFGTDAQTMVRLPYQGVGQIRMLEVAGPVQPLNGAPRANELTVGEVALVGATPFDIEQMLTAPAGRVDDFGLGAVPAAETEAAP
jgi:hypothetical protein